MKREVQVDSVDAKAFQRELKERNREITAAIRRAVAAEPIRKPKPSLVARFFAALAGIGERIEIRWLEFGIARLESHARKAGALHHECADVGFEEAAEAAWAKYISARSAIAEASKRIETLKARKADRP